MQPKVSDVKIESKPAFVVIGMVHRGKPRNEEIPQLWDRFTPAAADIQGIRHPEVFYGVCANFDEQTNEFDYMAACEVEPAASTPANMERWEIPVQTYAVFNTTLLGIGATMDFIYGQWLPTSGYSRTPGPDLEIYDETFNPEDPSSEFRIYVPILKA